MSSLVPQPNNEEPRFPQISLPEFISLRDLRGAYDFCGFVRGEYRDEIAAVAGGYTVLTSACNRRDGLVDRAESPENTSFYAIEFSTSESILRHCEVIIHTLDREKAKGFHDGVCEGLANGASLNEVIQSLIDTSRMFGIHAEVMGGKFDGAV